MISFAIFIGFLVLIYAAVEPVITKPVGNKQYSIESLKTNLIKNISADVKRYSLSIDESYNGDNYPSGCLKIITNQIQNNIIVKDEQGNFIESKYDKTKNELIIKEVPGKNEKYFIYSSGEFEQDKAICSNKEIVSCSSNPASNEPCYNLKFKDSKKHIFQSRIEALKNAYGQSESQKTALRKSLGIPERNWFWFDVTDEEGNSITDISEPEIPEEMNVYAKQIPITYIGKKNENGEGQDPENEKKGFLTIKLW